MDAISGAVQGGRRMIRVIIGYWIVCITVISLILCIAEDDIKEKLLIVGATGIFLACCYLACG